MQLLPQTLQQLRLQFQSGAARQAKRRPSASEGQAARQAERRAGGFASASTAADQAGARGAKRQPPR